MSASASVKMSKRILREIQNGMKSKLFGFFCDDTGKYGEPNVCYLRFAPEDEIYKGQMHVLKIKFSYASPEVMEYPKYPPYITFLTPIWHSNIDKNGIICLDILKETKKWKATYGIETVFNSLCLLLMVPTPEDPLNRQAAKNYKSMKSEEYKQIADEYYHQGVTSESMQKILNAPEYI